ncbi:MAG: lipopolysaccharide biosynthesis protein, partial [bacterium]
LKLPLPIVAFRSYGGYGVFAATGTAIWAGIMLSWFYFLPLAYPGYYPRPILMGQEIRQMLPFSAGNYLAELLNRTPTLVYPLLVLNVCGAEQSAFFYIAWMLAMVLTVIPTGIAQSLFAEGSYEPRKLWLLTRKSLALALVLAIPGALLCILVGGWFLHLFGPGYLEHGLGVVRLLSVTVIPHCLNALFTAVNQVQKRVHLVVAQGVVLASIALGVGSFLLKKTGLVGIGLGYLISHLAVAVLIIGPLLRAMKKPVVEESEPQITVFHHVN